MPIIRIPAPLRPYAGGNNQVPVGGATVGAALGDLTQQYPDLRQHLFEGNTLRNFVTVFLNQEDVRRLQGQQTPVGQADTLLIIPSIAGGSGAELHTNSGNVAALAGWKAPGKAPGEAPGKALAAAPDLVQAEVTRYSRHLIMPEVGLAGQRKLKAASVLLIGAGGLGAPVAMYLAAAGIGRLGIVDYDVVDVTNLQRQIIHGTKDIGRPKLASAIERIHDINPYVQVDPYEEPLTSANALRILEPYDVVIDGTDNFPTRYLTNDACVLLGKPNVYGSIFRFEGQASVFFAKEGPCYRCLFPEPPPPGLVPSCAEGGVLGVLPGTIGAIQATEAVKLILGIGQPLIGRMLLYDALGMTIDEVHLSKNPACPICGEHPTITELIDYEEFCGMPAHDRSHWAEGTQSEVAQITPAELKRRIENGTRPLLLDVREPHEWEISNLGRYGAVLIPKGQLLHHMNELDTAAEMVVYCRSGSRSADAIRLLREHGFQKLTNLAGGINRWALEVDPQMRRY